MSASLHLCESVERAAWVDLLTGAPARVRRDLGIEVGGDGDALLLAVRGADSSLVNRGFGIGGDGDALARAAAWYRSRGIDRYFLHLRGAPDRDGLARAGLARYPRPWLTLLRGHQPVARGAGLTVDDASGDDLARVAPLYCAAFDLPLTFAPVVAAVHGRPGWHAMVVRAGDAPVAVGLLHVRGDLGYLAGGATDPGFRCRGAQGALVAARTRRALARGCLWIGSETGDDVAGDPQHSLHNLRRAGFEVVGSRDNYAPRAMAAGAAGLVAV